MLRVASGAVLIAATVALVWLAPVELLGATAVVVALIGLREYVTLARQLGQNPPGLLAAAFTASACWVIAFQINDGLEVVLISGFIAASALVLATSGRTAGERAVAASRDERGSALGDVAAAIFPVLYLGVPLGALVAVQQVAGRPALFLLMITIIVSDTAQYYTGRLLGRRPLAPAISPKKTIEGAIGGFVFGGSTLVIAGHWWLPGMPPGFRALTGTVVVALGIAGDLFESMLKRSAGVKDSSALIPGHGGILDRIDALLFAAPVYYVMLKHV
ncbi:MAG TPA: phosphatidate cytidylyltransferase [Vicinamibacterales bacterium]|jgi:phosphatidate cytidylyltransferase|nr:phosphatidate cytidylyltransferase [Vicinamibacterales bacterium]